MSARVLSAIRYNAAVQSSLTSVWRPACRHHVSDRWGPLCRTREPPQNVSVLCIMLRIRHDCPQIVGELSLKTAISMFFSGRPLHYGPCAQQAVHIDLRFEFRSIKNEKSQKIARSRHSRRLCIVHNPGPCVGRAGLHSRYSQKHNRLKCSVRMHQSFKGFAQLSAQSREFPRDCRESLEFLPRAGTSGDRRTHGRHTWCQQHKSSRR